jgi:integrase
VAGKQAKILTRQHVVAALRRARLGRYPQRDRVMILLSVKAGLRAGEIAKLTWSMVLDANGRIADSIELHDSAAKKRSGRTIPLHSDLRRGLQQLRQQIGVEGAVIRSERAGPRGMRPGSVVNWFRRLYCELGLTGCSSHSGRRTFITNAARLVSKAGGSLCDVQQLAGHRSIEHTQAYIDGDTRAKRRLVALL